MKYLIFDCDTMKSCNLAQGFRGLSEAGTFPLWQLGFDMCGGVDAALDSCYACIDVGEVNSNGDCNTAIFHLGHRLHALKWALATIIGPAFGEVKLVGRIMVPGDSLFP